MGYAPFDLDGKVALITGGNAGIGLGMAEALAAAGAGVAVWGTNAEKNQAAVAHLRGLGARAEAFTCDVADVGAVEVAFADTLDALGRVDACFANAGVIGRGQPFVDLEPEEWRRVVSVNLDGVYHTLRCATRHMVARAEAGNPGGRLVVTSSLAAISGAARNEHYAATKGAVISMVKALAVELARHGITANALLPGWIETAMTGDLIEHRKFSDAVLPRIPARRWGQPADFGGIAVYLASAASAYHTGDTLLIDGGYFVF